MQLLQLVHGRHDEGVRSPHHARRARPARDRRDTSRRPTPSTLGDAYVFLRTVEHRLQLWDEQQTHTLPADEAELVAPGPRARLPRQPATDRARAVRRRAPRHTRRRSARSTSASSSRRSSTRSPGAGALPTDAAEERLAAFGFVDATHTRAALRELTQGLTRELARHAAAAPGDPRLALDDAGSRPRAAAAPQARRGADPHVGPRDDVPRHAGRRRARAAASSGRAASSATRCSTSPTSSSCSATTTGSCRERSPATSSLDAALETLQWRADADERRAGLRRFKRRELLRIGARDVLGPRPGRDHRARARRRSPTRRSRRRCEMLTSRRSRSRSSAWADSAGRSSRTRPTSTCCSCTTASGRRDFERAERTATDAAPRDRCDHRRGPDVRDRRAAPTRGQPGSARALARRLPPVLRALGRSRGSSSRCCAPVRSPATPTSARAFMALIEPFVYRDPFPEDDAREIRRIKARVEQERIPPGEDPEFHLKLGKRWAHRRRVHRAAAPARARRGAPRGPRAVDDGRAGAARGRRAPRPRRRRRAPGRVRVLRAGSQRALPRDREGRRRAPERGRRTCGSRGCSATCTNPRPSCATTTAGSPDAPARWSTGSSTAPDPLRAERRGERPR